MKRMYRKAKREKGGMTMIEVLVAILVVMLILGGFTTVVAFSANLLTRASTITQNEEAFQAEYYKKDTAIQRLGRDPIVFISEIDNTGIQFHNYDFCKNPSELAGTNITRYSIQKTQEPS